MEHRELDESYEPEVMQAIKNFVRPGDTCVDVGASIGFFTCMLSKAVGPDGFVYAFEPNRPSYDHLERNVAKHALNNVHLWKVALWKENLPSLKLHSVAELGYTSICHYHTTTYSEVVPARALDWVLGDTQVSFMKVDCEMSEFEVLQGAREILARGVDCVIVEFNYSIMKQLGISDHVIRNFMHELGYDMFLIHLVAPGGECLDPIMVEPQIEIEVMDHIVKVNVMFSTEALVRERWRSKTYSISELSQKLTESSKKSSLCIIAAPVE